LRCAYALAALCGVSCQITPPSGFFHCHDDQDCPADQMCQLDRLCHRQGDPGDAVVSAEAGVSDAAVNDAANDATSPDAGGCVLGTRRCQTRFLQFCGSGGQWGEPAACPFLCDSMLGCVGECAPDSQRCSLASNREQTCDAQGQWQDGTVCPLGCDSGGQSCSTCQPGASRCDGRKPQLCRDDGGAWVDNGIECSTDCVRGMCPVCMLGDPRRCNANNVERCGTTDQWRLDERCSGDTAVCHDGRCSLCAPDSMRCTETTQQKCISDGASWIDQSVRKDVCGAECDSTTTRCVGALVETCDASGHWSTGAMTPMQCGIVCLPGEQDCVGQTPRHCSDDGTEWLVDPIEIDVCGAECAIGSSQCIGTSYRTCLPTGLWSALSLGPPNCNAICVPGNVRCSNVTPQICRDDGSGWQDQTPQAGSCDCNRPAPPNYNQSCGSCGGKVQCDATCNVATPLDYNQSCGNCGGTVKCDGTCSVATPLDYNQSCGNCGGKVQCDGSCSVATPLNLAQSCGNCGGTVQCDGTCSVATPLDYNQDCGSCGGKTRCDESCSVSTPSGYNQDCGNCGGKVRCDGTCSVSTPVTFNQDCGNCGGKVQCDGSCSVSMPDTFNQDCGNCGGKVRCDGSCSIATPTDYDQDCGGCGGKIRCDGTCSVSLCSACPGTDHCCVPGPLTCSQCLAADQLCP
jgi:hypothetical protein